MDRNMLMVFYEYARDNKTFGRIVGIVYRFSSPAFFFIYVACGVYVFNADKRAFTFYVTVPFAQLVFNMLLRKLIKRERPYKTLKIEPPKSKMRKGTDSFSFPSNHSSSAGIIAFACMYANNAWGIVVFFLAMLTGLSRIFAGVHYPSDVLGGFVLSAVFAVIGFNLLPIYLIA